MGTAMAPSSPRVQQWLVRIVSRRGLGFLWSKIGVVVNSCEMEGLGFSGVESGVVGQNCVTEGVGVPNGKIE